MEVILAEKAGFCFGVKRAVDTAFEEAGNASNAVFTFGPIIHNEEVTNNLAEKGVHIVNSVEELDDLPEGSSIIIRSHGVGKDIFDIIESKGLRLVDATCPFVNNIHKIVRERSEAGDEILIIGNPGHAEVEGTIGWSKVKPYVINSIEDIDALPESLKDASITVVAQTTYSLKKFQEFVAELQDRYYNVNVCKTICNATEERQKEAEKLAASVDHMIVIGGKNSSNTQKLYEISKQQCNNTYYIQTLVDLDLTVFESTSRVGITAGASTPNYIIKEVQDSMSEKSFEELLNEETTIPIKKGQIIDGKVISVNPDEMVVDIHNKSDGILTAEEYSNSPIDLTTVVKEGDPITVEVIKPNDGEGSVLLSYKSILANEAYKELEDAFNNGTVLTGKVTNVLRGGLSVVVKECKVFIPASLVSDVFERDLSKYEGQDIDFVLTEFDLRRKRVIGDRKQLLVKTKAAAAEELFSKINVGDTVKCFIKEINGSKIALSMKFEDQNPWLQAETKYAKGTVVKGKVARMTDFGAFVVLEPGIDALLHVSQIDTQHVEKPSDVLKSGQEIEAKVVDIKVEDRKISLSRKALLIDQMPKEEKKEEKKDEEETVIPEAEEIKETLPVDELLAATAEAPVEEAPAEEPAAEEAPAEETPAE